MTSSGNSCISRVSIPLRFANSTAGEVKPIDETAIVFAAPMLSFFVASCSIQVWSSTRALSRHSRVIRIDADPIPTRTEASTSRSLLVVASRTRSGDLTIASKGANNASTRATNRSNFFQAVVVTTTLFRFFPAISLTVARVCAVAVSKLHPPRCSPRTAE